MIKIKVKETIQLNREYEAGKIVFNVLAGSIAGYAVFLMIVNLILIGQ